MKKLESFEKIQISQNELECIDGGSWLGEGIGFVIGTALRYAGPNGPINMAFDVAVYRATH